MTYRRSTQWGFGPDGADDWRDEAACRPGSGVDPELFFNDGNGAPALLKIAVAKQICGRCPVSGECLRWANGSGQAEGVWGGKTPAERRGLALEFNTQRWCHRCHQAYLWQPEHPYARICPDCATMKAVA